MTEHAKSDAPKTDPKPEKADGGGKDAGKSDAVKGHLPANDASSTATPAKKQPKEGATTFKVRTRGVQRFIRAGIVFGPDPTTVDASSLTEEQQVEMLNTAALDVDDGSGGEKDAATTPATPAPATPAPAPPAATHGTHHEPPPDAPRTRR